MNDPPRSPDEAAELERLRAEVKDLRAQLATSKTPAPPPRQRSASLLTVRKVIAVLLIALAGFGAVASVIGVWGARTTLNTDRWVATVGPLPQRPEVNAAMSAYLTDQVFAQLDVQRRVAEALPPKATFLAAPVTSAVRDYLRDTIRKFMATERFQNLWNNANRFAHAQIMAILEDRSETVSIQGDTVTLNLLPIVNDLLVTLEGQLPTFFGKKLDLPALSSGEIPPGLQQRIETALGVSLPANFAQITLYDRDRLGELQQAVVLFKRSVVLLVAGTLVLLALALAISPNRRRTILQFGLALIASVLLLTYVLRAVRDQLLALVPEGTYRDGVAAAMNQVFTTLRERGDQLLWIGGIVAVVAYLVGPGRLPVALRRAITTGAVYVWRTGRGLSTSPETRRWVARNLDPLRIAGGIAAVVLALWFSSWTALLVIILLLAGYLLLVTLLARSGQQNGEPPVEGTAAPVEGTSPAPL